MRLLSGVVDHHHLTVHHDGLVVKNPVKVDRVTMLLLRNYSNCSHCNPNETLFFFFFFFFFFNFLILREMVVFSTNYQ